MNVSIRQVVIFAIASILAWACSASAQSGVRAELRSSSALIPPTALGVAAPTAPAGAVVAGIQPWVCDAAQGFRPAVSMEQNVLDPILAIGLASGTQLPISAATTPASCGQMAMQSDGTVYVTQAVVDTKVTPSVSRGVLRTVIDPNTGALVGPNEFIATTAGLDGNQPTALAIGPDGSLYVGFLKNGNVKRILNPGVGTTQVVQSVGNTPQGHPSRAFAFVGPNLYIASSDSLSVILNATSSACTGGCNAIPINDGFTGAVHTGVTSDGASTLYFAVAGNFSGGSQVWRYVPETGLFTFVADGGADRNGTNASKFSFVPAKTNLLATDAGGNLWIGDDSSNGTAFSDGRLWTVPSTLLATLPGGSGTGGTNVQTIFNDLRGPWFMGFTTLSFTATFNSDSTFTATAVPIPGGGISTITGTWNLTPPVKPSFVANPQAHLTLTSSDGVVLISADFFLLNLDMLAATQPFTSPLGEPISGVFLKQTP